MTKRFAVVRFSTETFDDGEDVCFSECLARFETEAQAEAWRVRRFGKDDTTSMAVED